MKVCSSLFISILIEIKVIYDPVNKNILVSTIHFVKIVDLLIKRSSTSSIQLLGIGYFIVININLSSILATKLDTKRTEKNLFNTAFVDCINTNIKTASFQFSIIYILQQH